MESFIVSLVCIGGIGLVLGTGGLIADYLMPCSRQLNRFIDNLPIMNKEGKHMVTPYSGILHNTLPAREAKAPPTWADMKETKHILADFCIEGVSIPKVKTRRELVKWRTQIIKRYLDGFSA